MQQCNAFPACGGCLYLNLDDASYTEKKRLFIKSAFLNQGIDAEPEPLISVPFGRRRRAAFAYKGGIAGFNAFKSGRICPLYACPALLPELSDFLPALHELARYLKGGGNIFVLQTPFGIDLCLKENNPRLTLEKQEFLTAFALKNNLARLCYGSEPLVQRVQLPFPADAFLQPSLEGEKILIDLVLSHIGAPKRTADLFCGAGTFTRPIQKAGLSVTGYDINTQSLNPVKEITQKRDLFRSPLTQIELNAFDCVVLDPPRAGAVAQCRELAKSAVKNILMISCSPKTAARDVRLLIEGGFRVQKIVPVDQFKYSNHIELFIPLTKTVSPAA